MAELATEKDVCTKRRQKKVTPWQRRRRRALITLGTLGILGSVWLVWRLGIKTALDDALREAADFGFSTTKADYEARFGPYDGPLPVTADSPYQVVADAYVPASDETLKYLPRFSARHGVEALFAVPYDNATAGAMNALIDTNQDALTALHTATLSGAAVPIMQQGAGPFNELLHVLACTRAHAGDSDGAFQALEDGLVLLRGGDRGFGREARAIVPTGREAALFIAMGSVLQRVRFSEGQIIALQAHLAAGDGERQFYEMHARWASREIVSGRQPGRDARASVINVLTGFFDHKRTEIIRCWRVRCGLFGLPLGEQKVIIGRYAGEPWYRALRPEGPGLRPVVIHTALDVIRYTQDHGALPESLDALVPEYREAVPVDFWSAAPLRYHINGRSFSVYSVGVNQKDDGGDRNEDIVFKTTLPAQQDGGR